MLRCQVFANLHEKRKEDKMKKNIKQTSEKAARAASAVLRDKRTSAKSKTAAGSALAQKAGKGR